MSQSASSDLGLHCLPMSQSRFYTALLRHSDKNCAAMNKRYLDFVQTCGLILLVNYNHGDNTLKEILVYVYKQSNIDH